MKQYFIYLFIILSGCAEINEGINSSNKSYKEISEFLDQVLIENIDKKAKQDFLQPFKYIK